MKPCLQCPACRHEPMITMVDRQTGLEIDSCSHCLGLWFDGNELSALLPSRALVGRLLKEASGEPVVLAGTRHCPRCEVAMRPAHAGNVTLDVCPGCKGIWFDQGEVRRIVEASKHGLKGDPDVVEQIVLGKALEGISGLSQPREDPLGALLARLSK